MAGGQPMARIASSVGAAETRTGLGIGGILAAAVIAWLTWSAPIGDASNALDVVMFGPAAVSLVCGIALLVMRGMPRSLPLNGSTVTIAGSNASLRSLSIVAGVLALAGALSLGLIVMTQAITVADLCSRALTYDVRGGGIAQVGTQICTFDRAGVQVDRSVQPRPGEFTGPSATAVSLEFLWYALPALLGMLVLSRSPMLAAILFLAGGISMQLACVPVYGHHPFGPLVCFPAFVSQALYALAALAAIWRPARRLTLYLKGRSVVWYPNADPEGKTLAVESAAVPGRRAGWLVLASALSAGCLVVLAGGVVQAYREADRGISLWDGQPYGDRPVYDARDDRISRKARASFQTCGLTDDNLRTYVRETRAQAPTAAGPSSRILTPVFTDGSVRYRVTIVPLGDDVFETTCAPAQAP
jgi:hypothetical protein